MNRLTYKEEKLSPTVMIDADRVRWIKFYPYENPTTTETIAACEIMFDGCLEKMTFFGEKAEKIHNHFWNNTGLLTI